MDRYAEVCAINFFSEMRNRPPNRNSRFHALIIIPLLVSLTVTSRAQEYGFDLWTTANGLPQNTVTGVVQTPDGYLWVSTFDGLARFDGVRFTIFDKGNTKGIINNRFAQLFADREGVLYSITEGNIITIYRNGEFSSYSQFATAGERVLEIMSDDTGSTVFETERGYYSLQEDRFVLRPEKKETNVRQIYWGKSGAKWVIESTQISRHQNGQVTTYTLKLTPEELTQVISLFPYEDSHGALWLRRYPATELWRLQDGKATVFTKKEIPALEGLYPSQIHEQPDGSIWFLFSWVGVPRVSQLVRFKDNQFMSYELAETLGPTKSLLDREGNFWVATTTGLRRLRRKLITTLSVRDRLNSNEVYPLLETSNGEVLIGSTQGVNRYLDG